MNIRAWPVAVVVATILLASGCTKAQTPAAANSSQAASGLSSASAPASPTASPVAVPSTAAPPGNFTVCILPVVSCGGEMRTEPSNIDVSADGSGFVAGLTWTGWGSATAQGSGTLNINNCNPNCAQGSPTGYPATVTLSDLTPYSGGLQAYAVMTVTAPAASYNQTFSNLLP
jgi:hypothetical protein